MSSDGESYLLSGSNDTDIPWQPDPRNYAGPRDNDLLIAVSAAVFGFPTIVIAIICLLRLRVAYLDRRDKETHVRQGEQGEESSMLVDDGHSRTHGACSIAMSTISETSENDLKECTSPPPRGASVRTPGLWSDDKEHARYLKNVSAEPSISGNPAEIRVKVIAHNPRAENCNGTAIHNGGIVEEPRAVPGDDSKSGGKKKRKRTSKSWLQGPIYKP